MKKISLILFLFVLLTYVGETFGNELLSVTHYSLNLHVFPSEKRFEAAVGITITNNTSQPISEIPLLLYRLLDVREVKDESGSSLKFTQNVQKFKEDSTWQANYVQVELVNPLPPDGSTLVWIKYGGSIFGYSEVMQYVHDKIDENYSLLRPDALAYPMLSTPSIPIFLASFQSQFTFDIIATVPSGYVVACGGRLTDSTTDGPFTTFTFESKGPVQRMDIAIAKFKYLKDEINNISVYYLLEDEPGAINVLSEMKRVTELYLSLFGMVKNFHGYSAIEIPEGWGSQADVYSFLQSASAFKNRNISEVYHEISHTWNVKAKPEVERCRWFDEAFAMYFEALAVQAFEGDTAFANHMDRLRGAWLQRAEKDKKNFDTPIADYGREGLGQNSYTKGAWSLYVLNQLVGNEAFKRIIRTLMREFANKPADFKDFQSIAEKITQKDLSKYFDEWFYSSESSKLLAEKMSVMDIAKRY
jgi:aminopeptidase N